MKKSYIFYVFCLFISCGSATVYNLDKNIFTNTINTNDKNGKKQGFWEDNLCNHFKHNNENDFIFLVPYRNNKKMFSYTGLYNLIKEKNILLNHIPNSTNPNYINGSITYYKDKITFNTIYFDNGILTQLHSKSDNYIIDYYPIIDFSGKGSFWFKVTKNILRKTTIYEAIQVYDHLHSKQLNTSSQLFLELKDFILSLEPKANTVF